MTTDELKALLNSDRSDEKERAVEYLVKLLTSEDEKIRRRGHELLEEGFNDALYQSCLNYSSLVGGFTHPLLNVVRRTVEFWATSRQVKEL
jgi:hypothetical protein